MARDGVPVRVEVVWALPDRQRVVAVEVAPGATLRDAVERSGLLRQCLPAERAAQRVGVFGQLRGLDEPVRPGDRIEIYRPLPADPREMRRRRAAR